MKLKVNVKQEDLEKRGLEQIMSSLSKRVIYRGDTIIIVPKEMCLQSITLVLKMANVPYELEQTDLARER